MKKILSQMIKIIITNRENHKFEIKLVSNSFACNAGCYFWSTFFSKISLHSFPLVGVLFRMYPFKKISCYPISSYKNYFFDVWAKNKTKKLNIDNFFSKNNFFLLYSLIKSY